MGTSLTRRRVLAGIGGVVAAPAMLRIVSAAPATPSAEPTRVPLIDPVKFSTRIDNPYFPLVPGTVFHFRGEEDGAKQEETIAVLSDTKEVMGVTCVVVHDKVWEEGNLIEDTLDWYAQDADGNVWYFGEDSKDMEDGKVVSTAGSWEAGKDGAYPGIMMLAHPEVGIDYREEFYEGVAEDMARVVATDDRASVPNGDYTDVVSTENTTPLEPDVVEKKWYAKGVGLIREELIKGSEGVNELVKVEEGVQATPGAGA